MSVTVAELTVSLGPSAAPAMSDATFDAETTQLAVRARSGDREAFSALVELHERAARRVAIAALGKPAEADEAVQEACLTAWRRVDQLVDPASFRVLVFADHLAEGARSSPIAESVAEATAHRADRRRRRRS